MSCIVSSRMDNNKVTFFSYHRYNMVPQVRYCGPLKSQTLFSLAFFEKRLSSIPLKTEPPTMEHVPTGYMMMLLS